MTQSAIKTKVKKAIAKQKAFLASCETSDNPQIIRSCDSARGMLNAFEAVLLALDGSMMLLNVWAE